MTDLEAIKARLAAAKPGPWILPDATTGEVYAGDARDWDGPSWKYVGCIPHEEDADLIAHAPTDLAALVAEVERLRIALDALDVGGGTDD